LVALILNILNKLGKPSGTTSRGNPALLRDQVFEWEHDNSVVANCGGQLTGSMLKEAGGWVLLHCPESGAAIPLFGQLVEVATPMGDFLLVLVAEVAKGS
jgi:hypothetical protein